MGICKKLLIELRRGPPREDMECMLVGLRKGGQLKTNANVVCHVDCGVDAAPPSPWSSEYTCEETVLVILPWSHMTLFGNIEDQLYKT